MALLFATHIVMACVMTARIIFCFHVSRSIWYSKGYRRCSTHIENLIASFSLSRSLSITFFHTVFPSSSSSSPLFCGACMAFVCWRVRFFHGNGSFYFYSLFYFLCSHVLALSFIKSWWKRFQIRRFSTSKCVSLLLKSLAK